MNVLGVKTIAGPNVFADGPILIMSLDLEGMAERHSASIPGFTDRLLNLIPGLYAHRCSKRYAGGFVERLRSGTYMAHVIEHVALELSTPAGFEVTFGKTVARRSPRIYNIIVEYRSEAGMRSLLLSAKELVEAAIEGRELSVAEVVQSARDAAARFDLGPSTQAIVIAAEQRGIPWRRRSEGNLIQFGYGRNRKIIQATMTQNTSAIAVEIAGDKDLTKRMLHAAEIPTPFGEVVADADEAVEVAEGMGYPVAVKPLDANQGKGISLEVDDPEHVRAAFEKAKQHSSSVIVERMLRGKDYRALMVNGKVVAVSERTPAHVTGDGKSTVAQLIAAENQNPHRGEGHEKPLTKLRFDSDVARNLLEFGYAEDSVIPSGERVFLRKTANLSTGGTAKDVTEIVHPENIALFERASKIIGLDVCGLDVIARDISQPIDSCGGIVEVNAAPGIRMHVHPSSGPSRDAGGAIIDMLYPDPQEARIPIVAITGTNGKTTVTRIISHILQQQELCVGMTTTDGVWVNGVKILAGDTTGPRSARALLADPSVEVAVLETARGGLVRDGLAYDWSDVGIITNIGEDHIGQDGIEDVEDIINIKALVAERVREGGTLILNAEDHNSLRILERRRIKNIPRRLVLFSASGMNPTLERHVRQGGLGYCVEHGTVYEWNDGKACALFEIASIPLTIHGSAQFQIANVLAALAACHAQGVRTDHVAEALRSFKTEKNPGRCNLYKVSESYVLVDYGHNPPAFRAICNMTAEWRSMRITGVVAVPGDRANRLVEEAAKVIGCGFSKIIVREDKDRRGRSNGEVAELLCRKIRSEHPHIEVQVIMDELEACEKAVRSAEPGEMVVLFYDEWPVVEKLLQRHNAKPLENIEEIVLPLFPAEQLGTV
ncbi:MAG TPA: cyanophycin synthetase [Candidatus Eremiobacteraceae bacterium]|nr:cyanophycin synthetase [Candidatus Eremiobacteraceae bacterium]